MRHLIVTFGMPIYWMKHSPLRGSYQMARLHLNPLPLTPKFQNLVSSMKTKLKSNAEKADNCRERTKDLVGQLLKKLKERDLVLDEVSPYADDLDAGKEPKRPKKEGEGRAERTAAFSDLIDKLSKARSEGDMKPCMGMKLHLLNWSENEALSPSSSVQEPEKPLEPKQEPDTVKDLSVYSLHKM